MTTIGERIGKVIDILGIKKVQFAEAIKVDQSFVSQLVSGKRNPSDRTISDICREFGVREEYLRNGEEPMFQEVSESKKIAAFLGDLMREEDGSFKKQLIELLSEMTPEEWELMERMARRLTER